MVVRRGSLVQVRLDSLSQQLAPGGILPRRADGLGCAGRATVVTLRIGRIGRGQIVTTREYLLDQLAELPVETLEVSGKLGYAEWAPVLTFKPHPTAKPCAPAAPSGAIPWSRACQRKYLTQVTYPRTICYPLSDEPAVVALASTSDRRMRENERDIEAIARDVRFYKLTTLHGERLPIPYWCVVKYGPWSAVVVEQESCTVGVPNHWFLFVVELPEVQLEWYGTWDDIPPYPSLHVITGDLVQVHEGCTCCPGFKWCTTTGSCIDVTIECQDPVPV
jgi:hypothetical protein